MKFASIMVLAAVTQLSAQTVESEPYGFNKVTCLTNSDTIVGVPLRKEGSQICKLASAPVVNGNFATLALGVSNLPVWTANSHYVKFRSGAKDGYWYNITANTASALTINLNGDTISSISIGGDAVIIAEYWTLDTLFPPAAAQPVGPTTAWTETPAGSGNWVQNGNAVIASASTLINKRGTEIFMPDVVTAGTNLPAEGSYYVHAGIWKRSGSGNSNYGATKLYPDTLFTISQPSTVFTVSPSTVAHSTIFRSIGEVEPGQKKDTTGKLILGDQPGDMIIPLATQDTVAQDNFIAIPRPVDVTLDGLNLRQSGAFMASTGTLYNARKDQLLVFDNAQQLKNKAPSAVYYVHNGMWKLDGGGNINRGTVVIPASAGFIIRKYQVPGHPTSFWNNTPTY